MFPLYKINFKIGGCRIGSGIDLVLSVTDVNDRVKNPILTCECDCEVAGYDQQGRYMSRRTLHIINNRK